MSTDLTIEPDLLAACVEWFDTGRHVTTIDRPKPPVEVLGSGSTRTAFAISQAAVLKLQRDPTVDTSMYRRQTADEVTFWAKAHDEIRPHLAVLGQFDPGEMPRWCVMERARHAEFPCKFPAEFYSITGDVGLSNVGWVRREDEDRLVLIDYGYSVSRSGGYWMAG